MIECDCKLLTKRRRRRRPQSCRWLKYYCFCISIVATRVGRSDKSRGWKESHSSPTRTHKGTSWVRGVDDWNIASIEKTVAIQMKSVLNVNRTVIKWLMQVKVTRNESTWLLIDLSSLFSFLHYTSCASGWRERERVTMSTVESEMT